MIETLINTIINKLQNKEGLEKITWRYGEPLNPTTPDKGEGWVTLVPLEPSMMDDRSFTATDIFLDLFVVLTYRSVNQQKCDAWIHNKTELVWQVIKDNPDWDNTVSETHLKANVFMPSVDSNAILDKMFIRFTCHGEIIPST